MLIKKKNAHNDTIFMKKRLNSGDGDPPGGVADEVDEDDGDEQDRVGLQLGQPLRAHTGENQDDADIYISTMKLISYGVDN